VLRCKFEIPDLFRYEAPQRLESSKKTNNRYPSDGSEILARESNLTDNRIVADDRLIKFVLCLHKKL